VRLEIFRHCFSRGLLIMQEDGEGIDFYGKEDSISLALTPRGRKLMEPKEALLPSRRTPDKPPFLPTIVDDAESDENFISSIPFDKTAYSCLSESIYKQAEEQVLFNEDGSVTTNESINASKEADVLNQSVGEENIDSCIEIVEEYDATMTGSCYRPVWIKDGFTESLKLVRHRDGAKGLPIRSNELHNSASAMINLVEVNDAEWKTYDCASSQLKNTGSRRNRKGSVRVGNEYQTSVPGILPANQMKFKDQQENSTLIWDPRRAAEARANSNGDIDSFLGRCDSLNIKLLLMEALHKGDYNVYNATQVFCTLFDQSRAHFCGTGNHTDFQELFCSEQFVKSKDFKAIALDLGCSMETVLINYYNWKRKNPREYARIKTERKRESDVCEICKDGGDLIVCELCRAAYHFECLEPPLTVIPEGEWFCPSCELRSPAKLRRHSGYLKIDSSMTSSSNDSVDDLSEISEAQIARQRLRPSRLSSMESVSIFESPLKNRRKSSIVEIEIHNAFQPSPPMPPSSSLDDPPIHESSPKGTMDDIKRSHENQSAGRGTDRKIISAPDRDLFRHDTVDRIVGVHEERSFRPILPQKRLSSLRSIHKELSTFVKRTRNESPSWTGTSTQRKEKPVPNDVTRDVRNFGVKKSMFSYHHSVNVNHQREFARENSVSPIDLTYDIIDGDTESNEDVCSRTGKEISVTQADCEVAVASVPNVFKDATEISSCLPSDSQCAGNDSVCGDGSILYDVELPITPEGLLIFIKMKSNGLIQFCGYRCNQSGEKGFAERNHLFRAVGDILIKVDGVPCFEKSFSEVKAMLTADEVGKQFRSLRMFHPITNDES
jgi:PHD-finger/ELM2 domain